jgi:hypothetical protein
MPAAGFEPTYQQMSGHSHALDHETTGIREKQLLAMLNVSVFPSIHPHGTSRLPLDGFL